MSDQILVLSNVESAYGPIRAIRGVSLKVRKGEIATVLGSNGAGKTTILKTISGILDPRRGSVQFKGEDITARDPAAIVQRGLVQVPEGREVFPLLSVHDNLLMGAYTRHDRDGVARDIEQAFAYFPILKERERQEAGLLSGGQQQMVAIGRALMARPRIMLFDEPSLGLAPLIVRDIFAIVAAHAHLQTQAGLLQQARAQLLGQPGGAERHDEGDRAGLEPAFASGELHAAAVARVVGQQAAPGGRQAAPRQQHHGLLAGHADHRLHHLALAHQAQQRHQLAGQHRRAVVLLVFGGPGGGGLTVLPGAARVFGFPLRFGLGSLAPLLQELVDLVEVALQRLVGLGGLAQRLGLLVDLLQRRQLARGVFAGRVQRLQRLHERGVLPVLALGEALPWLLAELVVAHRSRLSLAAVDAGDAMSSAPRPGTVSATCARKPVASPVFAEVRGVSGRLDTVTPSAGHCLALPLAVPGPAVRVPRALGLVRQVGGEQARRAGPGPDLVRAQPAK